MPIMEGTTTLKTAQAEYDFAVQAGAIGAITLGGVDSNGNNVPSGAVVYGGYIEVDTILASGGAATVSVGVEGAADLLAATAFGSAPWSSTGRKAIIVLGAATAVKTTAARSVTITIAAATLTGGKFRVVLFYK